MSTSNQKHTSRVAAGLKASLHNPNVSEEAKASAKERLQEVETKGRTMKSSRAKGDEEEESEEYSGADERRRSMDEEDEEEDEEDVRGNRRRLAGYKGVLKNPRVSEEAKERAEKVLEKNDAL
ncbi:hypothetical protein FPV67DRAFT_1450931 [Lyophyllum atratum]|nr:hypothetical protein FPV67DRAFT_1450931 [Lyophyllum atratum]